MNYNVEETNHILYHNRSSKLIGNFLPPFDINYVLEKEKMLTYCRGLYTEVNESEIEFDVSDFNFDSDDIIFEKKDITELTSCLNMVIDNEVEKNYLIERNLDKLIDRYDLSGLSSIIDPNHLDIIGATTHPLLKKILGDGLSGGGIVFPLFENNELVNVAIRRIDNSNKMKYSLAIPDISLWGLYEIEYGSEIWITEGLIDRIFMLENGFENVISASTPGLSIIHLLKILEKKPSGINIWSDKDRTGLQHSAIIQKFFSLNNVICEVYVSEESKDPDDHFNSGLTKDDIYPIKVTKEKINSFPKNVNKNFLEYLKNRKY